MKDTTHTVVASIVTWNHAHCIEACIHSLSQQTFKNIDVVVFDNASCDGTREILEKNRYRIRLIFSSENLGFCGGHNAVLNQTDSTFVLLVNPDIILTPDYIEKAVARMTTNERIGTICGLLLQNQSTDHDCVIDGTGLTVARSRRFVLRHHGILLSSIQPGAGEVFGCDGALPLYRRKMIEDVSCDGQFFDEMFFAHKEDHDVSWRMQLYGWKTFFDPSCIAVHPRVFRPGNLNLRKTLAPEIKYHGVKNDWLLLLKNEDLSNFLKDFFHIVPRRLAILFYALVREPYSLKACWFVLKNVRQIWQWRQLIRKNRKVSPVQIRRRFSL